MSSSGVEALVGVPITMPLIAGLPRANPPPPIEDAGRPGPDVGEVVVDIEPWFGPR